MIQVAVLTLGAIFAIIGIVRFAKKGISGKNTIKMFGAEFQLAGSSLVVFVLGSILIIFAARMDNRSEMSTTANKLDSEQKSTPVDSSKVGEPPKFVTDYFYAPEDS
jgi:hypothetical protein